MNDLDLFDSCGASSWWQTRNQRTVKETQTSMPMISSVCGVMETGDAAEPRQRDTDMEEEDELRLVDVTSRIRQFQQTIRGLAEWAGPRPPQRPGRRGGAGHSSHAPAAEGRSSKERRSKSLSSLETPTASPRTSTSKPAPGHEEEEQEQEGGRVLPSVRLLTLQFSTCSTAVPRLLQTRLQPPAEQEIHSITARSLSRHFRWHTCHVSRVTWSDSG